MVLYRLHLHLNINFICNFFGFFFWTNRRTSLTNHDLLQSENSVSWNSKIPGLLYLIYLNKMSFKKINKENKQKKPHHIPYGQVAISVNKRHRNKIHKSSVLSCHIISFSNTFTFLYVYLPGSSINLLEIFIFHQGIKQQVSSEHFSATQKWIGDC